MSTSTQPSSHNTGASESAQAKKNRYSSRGWMLTLLVFVVGASSMALEMSASRLLAPYFGNTLFVWASLIGLILLYLTIGYYVGGRLADRYPRASFLYTLTGIAALVIALLPFISHPVLSAVQSIFASNSLGVLYGSLVSVILLFLIPTLLLGSVTPF